MARLTLLIASVLLALAHTRGGADTARSNSELNSAATLHLNESALTGDAAATRLRGSGDAAAEPPLAQVPPSAECTWWYETTAFHGWSVRNATAFGTRGDGVTDDTAPLRAAIDTNRGGDAGSNEDKSAALVYLPPGRYVVTDTLVCWAEGAGPLAGCVFFDR